ncbi:MAG: iron ABC transporter substrate-binding protein [Methanosarcina flavescens]|jgi:iron complex transport system substrate-binding protein|uniref:Iron ABC transporter substrate-binding protein n=1 Tax=Methanosarcina flavescens TaxID=1715806 RepID=A0A660HR54_9EURY|nr:iron ABC transporter substrate-binding protein [Methanosarcina flavescens]AYK14760.1 iron ABC transporter substrate-binding protein [Methanosarcina flavescens]NLK33377.1 iron ABC transporter substrate-binding protein [Methanosarcina flavescens]
MKVGHGIKLNKIILVGILIAALVISSGCAEDSTSADNSEVPAPAEASGVADADEGVESAELTLTDGFGRKVTIPGNAERLVCSGSGCLRYLVYLQAEDYVVGVDSMEKKVNEIEGRPYFLANPQLKDYPLIGEFRGKDDPEKLIEVNPQIILKSSTIGQASAQAAAEADTLQSKTGIPVISFPYGSLNNEEQKAEMYSSLRIMGEAVGKQERAEEVIAYIEATMQDLESRTADIPESERKTVYVGGVSMSGAHGIVSTEPAYAPFLWVNADNVAAGMGTEHADIAKEALVGWDPEYIFIDVGTLQLGNEGAIGELKSDASLTGLSAVKNGKVYGVIPYNFYSTNYESVLANAYFIGKVLYPDRFEDVDPEAKADEIYTFFVGKPVFSDLNEQYDNLGFKQISL